jgi:hypothetical protein
MNPLQHHVDIIVLVQREMARDDDRLKDCYHDVLGQSCTASRILRFKRDVCKVSRAWRVAFYRLAHPIPADVFHDAVAISRLLHIAREVKAAAWTTQKAYTFGVSFGVRMPRGLSSGNIIGTGEWTKRPLSDARRMAKCLRITDESIAIHEAYNALANECFVPHTDSPIAKLARSLASQA